MTNQAGTVGEESSTPGKSKFEEATSAMTEMLYPKNVSEELPDGGTPDEADKEEDNSKEKQDSTDWEQRYKHVQSYADKKAANEERLASNMLQKDPEYIHTIAELDQDLANRLIAKELGKSHGIKTYAELVEAIEVKAQPVDKKVLDVDKRVAALEKAIEEKEEAEAMSYVAAFSEEHPEFTGKIEKQTWELFDKGGLTLEEAFDYVMYKNGLSEKESKMEEKAYEKAVMQKAAASIPSASASGSSKGSKGVKLDAATKEFLEGIGATKTLSKYS